MSYKIGDRVEYYNVDRETQRGCIVDIEKDIYGYPLYKMSNCYHLRSQRDIKQKLRGAEK